MATKPSAPSRGLQDAAAEALQFSGAIDVASLIDTLNGTYTLDPSLVRLVTNVARKTHFCLPGLLGRSAVHPAPGVQVMAGMVVTSRPLAPLDTIATFYPTIVIPETPSHAYPTSGDTMTMLSLAMVAFVVADDDWLSRWYSTIPDIFHPTGKWLTDDILLVMQASVEAPDEFGELSFVGTQFERRLALFSTLRRHAKVCQPGCDGLTLHSWEYLALIEENVFPNAAFTGTSKVPCTPSSSVDGCTLHARPLVLLAERPFAVGGVPLNVRLSPYYTMTDERLVAARHPAATYPQYRVATGTGAKKAVAIVDPFGQLVKMVSGSEVRMVRHLDKCQFNPKANLNAGELLTKTCDLIQAVLASTHNLRSIAESVEHWPSPLTHCLMRWFSMAGLIIERIPTGLTIAGTDDAFKLLRHGLVPNLHRVGWPSLLLDLVSALEEQNLRAVSCQWDELRAAAHAELKKHTGRSYPELQAQVAAQSTALEPLIAMCPL